MNLKVVIGPTQQHAAKDMGASAGLAAADPDERGVRRRRIGELAIVDEEMALTGVKEGSTGLDALSADEGLGPLPEVRSGDVRRTD
ncbi:hypothetical protein GCM10010862_04870 [Devosia nitrariae]|uniref:Uncharacterized protein n=1 Tax=Devosia nitrariae TaxID=2071872 RepID=A0ABQ5VZK0_9HYPH|nr:hypothetical protein GCM10010862_04870 [Devosia nitrariae]